MKQANEVFKGQLPARETKHVFLAIAFGCLELVDQRTPGEAHSRRKRELQKLKEELVKDVARKLRPVMPAYLVEFRETLRASHKVIEEIVADDVNNTVHVLLNLVGFCMHMLDMETKDRNWARFDGLFEMYDGVSRVDNLESGEKIMERIKREVTMMATRREMAV